MVVAIASIRVPVELAGKVHEFLEQKKTGNITIDIKEGAVMSWRVTESGRVKVDRDEDVALH